MKRKAKVYVNPISKRMKPVEQEVSRRWSFVHTPAHHIPVFILDLIGEYAVTFDPIFFSWGVNLRIEFIVSPDLRAIHFRVHDTKRRNDAIPWKVWSTPRGSIGDLTFIETIIRIYAKNVCKYYYTTDYLNSNPRRFTVPSNLNELIKSVLRERINKPHNSCWGNWVD